MKAYAGIGSRQTPQQVLEIMAEVAEQFAKRGYVLRSGAAKGADSAFEQGCKHAGGRCEIYLPWPRFRGHGSELNEPSDGAQTLASVLHPVWNKCSQAARKLHARNCHQVLGADLRSPVDFIMCWHQNSGGTLQAIRVAQWWNQTDPTRPAIRIHNLNDPATFEKVKRFIERGKKEA